MKPSTLSPADELLTREEVAQWLKISSRDVERLRIPCLKISRKRLRYFRGEVMAWLNDQRRGSA